MLKPKIGALVILGVLIGFLLGIPETAPVWVLVVIGTWTGPLIYNIENHINKLTEQPRL